MYSRIKETTRLLGAITLAILHFACEKEETAPKVQTVSAVATSSTQFEAKASLIERGTLEIIDYGFIYSTWEYCLMGQCEPQAHSIEGKISGSFSATMPYSSSNNQYFVRAYVTNSKGTVYGDIVSFQAIQPTVSTIEPLVASVGDIVVIKGENFSTTISEISVRFNYTDAQVLSASNTEIRVKVPDLNSYSFSSINISINIGVRYFTIQNFKLVPKFFDFSPKNGTWGTIIIVNTEGFYSSWGTNFKVYLNDIQCSPYDYSSSYVKFQVPYTNVSESSKVRISHSGVEYILEGEFTMDKVKIESLSNSKAIINESITINGENFFPYNYYYNNGWVKIGEVEAQITSSSSSQINIIIPPDLSPGVYAVTVSNGHSTDILEDALEVIVPEVTDFWPKEVYSFQEITISGRGFSENAYMYVEHNYSSWGIQRVDYNTIKFNVPSLTQGGDYLFSLVINDKNIPFPQEIKVIPSIIESFTPTEGVPGTLVEIRGKGLPYSYYTPIYFGTTPAHKVSLTDTLIKVQVPSNSERGKVKISISDNNHVIVSDDDFTVL